VCDENVLRETRQRVYVANHSSHLDFIVLWSALPPHLRRVTRPVAARDYWQKTALRRYLALKIYKAILIERERVSASNNPIELVAHEMANEYSIIIFPEGTRGSGDEIGQFKSGIYRLLQAKPHLECVPVYIEDLNRVLPKGEFLPLPLLSSLSLGAPIRLEENEDKRTFLTRLRDSVVALKEL
jgi:1-acyl-sn-glycerol-3-phosphate acyltransferase